MPTIQAQKIASVVYRLGLNKKKVEITSDLQSRVGNVVVVRALGEKRVYNTLELDNGRMVKITRGDVIVGALGTRRALQGFVGRVPESVQVGDTLQILNMGGVMGESPYLHKDLGRPTDVEILGMAVKNAQTMNVSHSSLPHFDGLSDISLPPIVMISGTCMNSGKTFACTQIIQQLTKKGLTVHSGKLSGIACRRDLISMEDHGALRTASFLDAGYPSTADMNTEQMVQMGMDIIGYLADGNPHVIFLELGDGIIGDYGVLHILENDQMARAIKVHLFCASDLVGSWGGHQYLAERDIPIHLVSGPATDSPVGVSYIEDAFAVPAINARLDPESLGNKLAELLGI